MKIDLTVLPAKVTITNINVKPAKVGEENIFWEYPIINERKRKTIEEKIYLIVMMKKKWYS